MIKTYEDYLDKMQELFPEIPKDYINDIIKYGLKEMISWTFDHHDYAIDYKWPKSSILVSNRNYTGMTTKKKFKLFRKNQWLDTKRKILAISKEHNVKWNIASKIYKKNKKCQEETK